MLGLQSKDRLDEFIDELPAVRKVKKDVISSNGELASECTRGCLSTQRAVDRRFW
jgi:hypothetical protein